MLLDGGFAALLLLITAVSAEKVPPPTNVTVRCQNLQITVHWEYSKQEPQTRFGVKILGTPEEGRKHENETTDHQYDLSNYIWESEKHYMGYNYVNVTAIQGGNQSVPVSSKSFTYKYEKTAHIKCELDFPPFNLTVKDSKATVRFENPLHYYKKLKRAIKQDAFQPPPVFRFQVSINGTDFNNGYCRIEDHICTQAFSSIEGVNCVKLRGQLFDGSGTGHVPFRETEQICASELSDKAELDVYVMTLFILLAIFVLISIVIISIICKEKACTINDSLPKPLEWPPESRPIGVSVASERDPSVVELIIHRPKRSPSLTSEEEIDLYGSLQDDNSAASDLQPLAGCLYMERGLSESSNEDLGAARLRSEGHRTDDDSLDDSVKTECVSLDSEEEERSPYDCPHTHMDMGDGDFVLGYNK
ncbi:interferon gamma receptor 1 [Thunnus maccoyii]|uniref:interferon gamma receptor 1 n=1 Tax=Thunnus maccoyii TaxID=8240 RepID=UPI001C4BD0A4|nr:interferon gamma receptor 1 [Thunnus maccoyii]XP_042255836.1 interferon gamma receptor 1 [Thunnus maccoyii]XP_042255844.1 interferon gamma receptor 1 [Thunnus maccoyii]